MGLDGGRLQFRAGEGDCARGAFSGIVEDEGPVSDHVVEFDEDAFRREGAVHLGEEGSDGCLSRQELKLLHLLLLRSLLRLQRISI